MQHCHASIRGTLQVEAGSASRWTAVPLSPVCKCLFPVAWNKHCKQFYCPPQFTSNRDGWACHPSQLRAGGGGGSKPVSQAPPPLIGLLGLGPPKSARTFQASYLKCTVPLPLGKGTAPTSSNHLPELGEEGGGGRFDAPEPEMSNWLREAFGRLLLLWPQAGHKAHHACTSRYAYATMFSSSNDIHH